MAFLLLERFKALFSGVKYLHRDSSLGDSVAEYLTEDLFVLKKSSKFNDRIALAERVQNTQNRRVGVDARRGDGTFGELVAGAKAIKVDGFHVARGPIATVEIGVEVKILCKAMNRQIDRVMRSMEDQIKQFRAGGGRPISIGIVGVNHAARCTTYEGDVAWPTTGKGRHKHPIQEAAVTETKIRNRVGPQYDEVLFVRFRAENVPPYDFEWVNQADTELEYGAILTRTIRRYEQNF